MPTLTIAWHDYNMGEDGFNIYRSDSPMDVSAMPTPIASVGPNIGSYDDTTVVGGNEYYYRIGVLRNGKELISEEKKLLAANFTLVSGSNDNTLRKIDPYGNEIWTFSNFERQVRGVDIDNTGHIYAGSLDGTLKKLDSSGNQLWSFSNTSSIWNISIDIINEYVYAGLSDDTVRKINTNDGTEVTSGGWPFTGHTSTVYDVAVDPNGNVYTAGNDSTVKKIDPSGNEVWSFNGHSSTVRGVAVDFNNGYVYSGGSDYILRKVNISDGSEVTSGGWPFTGHTNRVYGIVIDSVGNVYSASWDNTLKKIDSDGNEIWTFSGHSGRVYGVAIDKNGYIITGSYDNTVKKIDPDGNEVTTEEWPFTGHTSNVYDVAVYLDY